MKNMMFSGSENIDYSQSTKKTFGSRNLFVLIMAILAAVSDFALLIVFAVAGHGGLAIPIILLIIDGLFIAGICLSNFRFKYTIGIWVAYLIVSVIVTSILASLDSGATYMTDTAKSLNVFAHLVLYIVTVFASIYPLFKSSVKIKAIMITAVTVAVVLVGTFSIYFSVNGYFGQGFVGGSRVVGYTLDEKTDTYIASSIKSGRSDKVIIPEQFNGKKVSGINCSIFTHTSIKTVELQSPEKMKLVDTQLLEYINGDLKIGVDKNYIDAYRKDFLERPYYSYPAAMEPSLLAFANSLYPINLEGNERYITFAYGEMPKQSKIIPTWIGKAGEKFQLDFAGDDIDYLKYADHSSVSDLVWCYNNNNSKILTGEMLVYDGSVINKNLDSVKVQFENVYAIKVEDDNDEKFEPSDDFKTTQIGNAIYDRRFVTLNSANALLEELSRDGFDLSWEYKVSPNSSSVKFESLRDTIYGLGDEPALIYIQPVWKMKPPTDLAINFDKSSYVYGDDVKMVASAKAPDSKFKLQYDWNYLGNGLNNTSISEENYSIFNALPQYGTFTVNVTVTCDDSSLSSIWGISKELQVGKRPLHITWTQPDDMVYNYFEKTVVHRVGEGELINGDFLANNITKTNETNINAGDYVSTITLKGRIDELYYIASGATYQYTIEPRPTAVDWTCGDYTYDGDPHNASATAKNVFGNDLAITVSDAKVNADIHTAIATCSDSNYKLTNPNYKFEIKQKSVELVAWDNSPITYSGLAQYPRVANVSGLVGNEDMSNINNDFVYSGYSSNIDAGEGYTVKVDLSASSNYKFDSQQSTSYNIGKKALTIRTVATNKTYDGNKAEFDFEVVSGLASVHTKNSLGAPTYSGNGANAIDADTYSVNVTLPINSVTKNYDITYESASFVIGKAQASIAWSNVSVSNGKVNPPSVLINGQVYSGNIVVESYVYRDYYGREIDSIPYQNGTYSVQVVASSKNYTFTNTRITFTVDVTAAQGEVA
ncbi:MAG: hypothetical protein K2M75_01850 [Clostridia bacterium]|nr:hypothetical protein [Clostridia bacterium]